MKFGHYSALLLCLLCPQKAVAQSDFGFKLIGVASIQPVDDDWVGSPYLDEGIGGIAPGVAAGINVISSDGFVAAAEFSTSAFEQFQTGRLVRGTRIGIGHESTATTRLRDSLFSGLIGFATSDDGQRLVVLAGVSAVMTSLTQDDVGVDDSDSEPGLEGRRRFAPTGGIDYLQRLTPRVALQIGARYSWLGRSENADQTGAGSHILRIGAGVRIGLGQ